jgi:hypothetical protein
MKNLFRLSGCLLLAAILGLSSCVKNEVAPEVAQLRQSQIAKLNAEVAKIIAQTQTITIQNAFAEAMNAITVQQSQAELDETLAWLEVELMEAQAELAAATEANEAAKLSLEMYLTDGVAKEIGETWYYYSSLLSGSGGLYYDRLDLQEDLALAQLLVNSSNLPWDVVVARLEESKALLESELTAEVAALADLEEVIGDPTTLQTKKAAVRKEIAELEMDIVDLEVLQGEAEAEYDAASQALDDAELAIGLMEDMDFLSYISGSYGNGFIQDEIDLIADSLGYVKDIATANQNIAQQNTLLALANSTLTALKSALASATAAYNTQLNNYNTLLAAKVNADADVALKTELLNVAQQNLDAANAAVPATPPATITSLTAIRDAAQTALTAAQTVQTNANNSLAPATTAKNNAKTTMDNAQIAITGYADPTTTPAPGTPQDNVNDILAAIDSYNDDIADANANLADNAVDLAAVRAKIVEWTPRYEAALTALPALQKDVIILQYKAWNIGFSIASVEAMIDAKEVVLDALDGELENLADAIADQKETIQDLEDDIADLEVQIAQGALDKAWAEGKVLALQAELADLEIQIEGAETMLAYWKTKLDEALAGN